MVASRTLQDAYVGVLWGGHIGDSLWAPCETMTADQVAEYLNQYDGLGFHQYRNPWQEDPNGDWLPPGRPTDDTDQVADLCHSLLACDGFDADHFRQSLQNSVIAGHSRLWPGFASGAGRRTKMALGSDPEERRLALEQPYDTNGSLMRAAPLALWFGPSPMGDHPDHDSEVYQTVKAMSEVTHTHPDSVAACWLYVRMLRKQLAGADDLRVECDFDNDIFAYIHNVIHHGLGLPPDPGSFENGWGSVAYTLKVALHAVFTTQSFVECMHVVGRAGGDTDTYASVAGSLAGAGYDVRNIPLEWKATILGSQTLSQHSQRIYEVRKDTWN